ncbi:MAG: RNA polymerase sigma factor [Planctomycetota bacterium]
MFREDSDKVLMLRFQEGDTEAFRALMMRYRHSLMSFAYRFVGDTHVAEDVFQDTFLRIVRDAYKYRPSAKFITLLYTIARNLCIDHLRKQKYRRHLSLERNHGSADEDSAPLGDMLKSDDVGANREMLRKDLKKVLTRQIGSLPVEQREVFLLREYEGLRFNEIAKITGTSVNTAKSRMRYALAALRKFLSQEKITDEVLQNELL